jgi:hypothetical protein
VNATVVVSIAGLIATTTVGVLSPVLHGRFAARNAAQARRYDQQLSVYADAMQFTHARKQQMEMSGDPDDPYEANRASPDWTTAATIGGRLHLLGTADLIKKWDAFQDADSALRWHALEECPVDELGQPEVAPDDPYMVTFNTALENLIVALRKAAGVEDAT